MARSGLTKSQVKASRQQLLAEGRYPSVDAVRHALGDTGSKSTIHKYLKELSAEDGQAGQAKTSRAQTADSLRAMVDQLADRLHDDVERQVRELEASLRRKDDELATLRRKLAQAELRLEQMEAERAEDMADVFGGRHSPPATSASAESQDSGFGNFSNLFASSRSGQRDDTPFNIILAGGRAMTIDLDSPQIRLSKALS